MVSISTNKHTHKTELIVPSDIKLYSLEKWQISMCLMLTSMNQFAESHQGPHEKRLLNNLLNNYNTLERPVSNESDALTVRFGLTLQQIIDVVSVHSIFSGFDYTFFFIDSMVLIDGLITTKQTLRSKIRRLFSILWLNRTISVLSLFFSRRTKKTKSSQLMLGSIWYVSLK